MPGLMLVLLSIALDISETVLPQLRGSTRRDVQLQGPQEQRR